MLYNKNMPLTEAVLDSDFPTDILVVVQQSQIVISGDNFGTFINVPHGLPFRPLPYIVWSLSPTFEETYIYTTPDELVITDIFALNTENITIGFYNYRSSAVTIYYRLYAFPPSTITAGDYAPATSQLSTPLAFNSDDNYLGLVSAGQISTSDRVFTHNLGYKPFVLAWLQTTHDPYVFATSDRSTGSTAGILITETNIQFVGSSINDTAVEYRLYRDS